MKDWQLIFKSFYSNAALEELYNKRRALHPSVENRTRLTVTVTFVLFSLTFVFLMVMAWSRETVNEWIADQPISWALERGAEWNATPIREVTCDGADSCRTLDSQRGFAVFDPQFVRRPYDMPTDSAAVTVWRLHLPASAWQRHAHDSTIVLTLPAFEFSEASVTIDGELHGIFRDSNTIAVHADPRRWTMRTSIDVEVMLKLGPGQDGPRFGRSLRDRFLNEPALMPVATYRQYVDLEATDGMTRGDYVGVVARIVMAVFVLILFLLVDGSPESLGLGLYMGFEAFAISLSFKWLNVPYLEFVRHFCYQMGDICRLYFLLQLARVVSKRFGPWLLWGSVLSALYGAARQSGADMFAWVSVIPPNRDLAIGIVGVTVCWRCAFYLRNKGLPWRFLALVVAGFGAMEQVIDAGGQHFDFIAGTRMFQTITDVYQPLAAWLFAFSAHINISTLENRVRTLSRIEVESREIRRDMELGQAVQESFLDIPELPPELAVSCYHEPMLFVSGDTYFVNWNAKYRKLTFLINDVTGHGVQAALKASAVTAIAHSVWGRREDDQWTDGRLERYSRLVNDFFARTSQIPDILAMCGGEFDPEKGTLRLYRINFPYPIIVTPTRARSSEAAANEDTWRVDVLPLRNERPSSLRLQAGSFVILASDGLLDGSRELSRMLRVMREKLSRAPRDLDAQTIKELILEQSGTGAPRDDRSLSIFHWRPHMAVLPSVHDGGDKASAA